MASRSHGDRRLSTKNLGNVPIWEQNPFALSHFPVNSLLHMKMKNAERSQWHVYLAEDFEARKRRNQAFSLRSYAQLLEVSPTHLSSILSGKRTVTAKTALHFSEKLGVSPAETLEWLSCEAEAKGSKHSALTEPEFHAISEWYYFAILALARLKRNFADPAWIARRLNIPLQIANQALTDLVKHGHLEISGGRLKRCSPDVRTKSDAPSATVRRFHRQTLQIASQKLESVPVEKREFIHLSLPMDRKRIKAAKKVLRKFADDFAESVTRGEQTEVYHFNMSFFPVSEEK